MMATSVSLGALRLSTETSISMSCIRSCEARSLKSIPSVGAGTALRRSCSSVGLERVTWMLEMRRPVWCRGSDRQSVKSSSVVDKDGKVEGVIQVELEELPQPSWGRIFTLGGGDVAFLLLLAAIGRLSHGFPGLDWETIHTADPFIAGWFVGSYFTGGYGPEGQGLKGLKMASFAAVKSWAVGIPLALAIRGFAIGHVPVTPFMLVSLASTFVLQVGWRTAFTAIVPNDDKSFQKKKGNRKGSAFEFFELLTSLVKRW